MRDLDEVARVAAPLVEKYRILLPIDCKCAEFDRAPDPEPTDRQLEVARLLFEGLTHKEVAERRGPTPSTSRRHMCKLRDRLGVDSNEEAFLLLGQRRDLERT